MPVKDINVTGVEHSNSISIDILAEIKSEFKIVVN